MSDIWLITGGARSGKSAYAEELAMNIGRVLYIATGVACDDEMIERIERHRQNRPKDWITWERYRDLADIENEFDANTFDVILLDCAGNLLMGILFEEVPDADDFTTIDFERVERLSISEIDALCAFAARHDKRLIFVTNEIGMGIVPDTLYSRCYRDALGRINKHTAKASDNVVLMVTGLPLKLK